ncbi:unnamed protein product [Protopolystoma xenopodis]|uniref:PLAT domain-containing protein n=1 Tax=Protopolystoma xenopodis TaxID=117903 RepID=A0A448XE12_9PLAT|nr:unnamed protein product [Protopolystoma xenopodis]
MSAIPGTGLNMSRSQSPESFSISAKPQTPRSVSAATLSRESKKSSAASSQDGLARRWNEADGWLRNSKIADQSEKGDYDDDDLSEEDWQLDSVKGEEDAKLEEFWFISKKWLAIDEGDKQIVREILATTEEGKPLTNLTGIQVRTLGELMPPGARFSQIQIGPVLLSQASDSLGLGRLVKLRVAHDNSGVNPSWFLDYIHVIVEGPAGGEWGSGKSEPQQQEYLFPCYQWLAKDRDDGLIARELLVADDSTLAKWRMGWDVKGDARLTEESEHSLLHVKPSKLQIIMRLRKVS